MKIHFKLLAVAIIIVTVQCVQKKKNNNTTETKELVQTYSEADFKKVAKIDTHAHINSEGKTMINLAKANNFRLLNVAVDVDGHNYPPLREQIRVRILHQKENPKVTEFSTAFTLEGWDGPNWSSRVLEQLKSDFELGANSVKTWKNIGMDAKDKNGNMIVLDDPKFDPIFKYISDQGKVWLSHAGEPLNCWLPLDSMTVKNDRDYFSEHPKYHMYLHPELPSYQEQIDHRDNVLVKNPDLIMIAFHMGSLEWSVEEAAKFLERFPNANLDLAERISHTQYQSQRDRKKVRNFFIKYQDRILYAADFGEDNLTVREELEEHMLTVWRNDWKYFNTDKMVTVPQLSTPVQGLALPKEVVDKIYRLNAERIFPNAWVTLTK